MPSLFGMRRRGHSLYDFLPTMRSREPGQGIALGRSLPCVGICLADAPAVIRDDRALIDRVPLPPPRSFPAGLGADAETRIPSVAANHAFHRREAGGDEETELAELAKGGSAEVFD
jgi:hypothetical protein